MNEGSIRMEVSSKLSCFDCCVVVVRLHSSIAWRASDIAVIEWCMFCVVMTLSRASSHVGLLGPPTERSRFSLCLSHSKLVVASTLQLGVRRVAIGTSWDKLNHSLQPLLTPSKRVWLSTFYASLNDHQLPALGLIPSLISSAGSMGNHL